MKVSVVGTGYVGLVSGVCLAAKGHQVTCVDIDADKVSKINQGMSPIYEEGLDELLQQTVGQQLKATTDLRQAVLSTDLSIIAVGTPFDGSVIDLRYIKEVAEQIGTVLKDKPSYHLVVVKSTVVPGTTDDIVRPILESASGKQAGPDFGVGMNPEFLKEGEAIKDFMAPDRIVLGGIDARSIQLLGELYSVFEDVDKLETSCKTAEMIKYTANSLLATMISFANEIGNLCTALGGIDVVDVMEGVHLDKRLSPILSDGTRIRPSFTTYIEAGCGFGGSCFPKDVKALIAHGKRAGEPMQLLESVIRVNLKQPNQLIRLLKKHSPDVNNLRVAILGLAFKPGTDDIRESPALPVMQSLLELGAQIKAYDPIALEPTKDLFKDSAVVFCDRLEQAIDDAQAIVLVTRWPEFSALPDLLAKLPTQPLVIDGRRMLDKESVAHYDGIGL